MSGCSELARAFLDETFTESPVLASQLGVDGFDDQLDDLSESAIEQRRRRSQDWLRRFESSPTPTAAASTTVSIAT